MCEEWKKDGELLKELDLLRSRIAQLEQLKYKSSKEESVSPKEAFLSFFNSASEGGAPKRPGKWTIHQRQ